MYDYSIPQFTDIEVEADNEEEAKTLANEIFSETYPEAMDPEVVQIDAI